MDEARETADDDKELEAGRDEILALVIRQMYVTTSFPGQKASVIAVAPHIRVQLLAGRKFPFYEWSTPAEIDRQLFGGRWFGT